jgi:adenine-specific DNA-methyltransferase
MSEWGKTLLERGYRLKTGQVIDFRESNWLRTERADDTVPLIWPCNFEGGNIIIRDPLEKKPQYFVRSSKTERVMLSPGNYVLVKRFTSKEESRRIQCAVLPCEFFDKYGGACVENHVNILTKRKGNMSTEEMMGLYVLFNSSYYDDYYRLLNGSTQVNATEFNSMCSPSAEIIAELGVASCNYSTLDMTTCDFIINTSSNAVECKDVKEEIIWKNWTRPNIY